MTDGSELSTGMALFELFLLLVGLVAGLAALASGVWLMVVAFQTHVGWGLGIFFCYPFGAIAFVAGHWKTARLAALVHVLTAFLSLAALGTLDAVDPPLPEDDPAAAARPTPGP